ncbi:hypothetical protein [Cohnella terricola]|uniref:GAF domain-containing protein n=1 Tax=Cohnella terricola TaxID=1289167 RepID=A0A559J7H7_9BACL|nr:hypothetical protein [Cohnella terricola]TVX95796.1 hypothetical protein FPZ45_22630 [Cohnella terricola]
MMLSQMMSAFRGAIPSIIVTSGEDGRPNVANLSKIWLVDDEHIAIANQMLNKTELNLAVRPLVFIKTATPGDLLHWELEAEYIHAESGGALFESVRQHMDAIAWMAGLANPLPLRSMLIFRVLSVRKCSEEAQHLAPVPETCGDLLKVLSETLGMNRAAYWALDEEDQSPRLLASRGIPGAEKEGSAFASMRRFAEWAGSGDMPIRMQNISSQMRYANSSRSDRGEWGGGDLPNHLLAFPVMAFGERIGVVCCEETGIAEKSFDDLDDRYLAKIGERFRPDAGDGSLPERQSVHAKNRGNAVYSGYGLFRHQQQVVGQDQRYGASPRIY